VNISLLNPWHISDVLESSTERHWYSFSPFSCMVIARDTDAVCCINVLTSASDCR